MQLSVSSGILLCLTIVAASIQLCPHLGSAVNFTVIAASSVSNDGSTVINGNLASEIFTNCAAVLFMDLNATGHKSAYSNLVVSDLD